MVEEEAWVADFGGPLDEALQRAPSAKVKLKRLSLKGSPFEVFSKLQLHHDHAYLLESTTGPRKLAEYSFIGFDPCLLVKAKDHAIYLHDRRSNDLRRDEVDDPLEKLREIVGPMRSGAARPRLIGGAVGYISYDAIRYWERLPSMAKDETGYPEFEFGIFDEGLAFDHRTGSAFYHYVERDRSDEVGEGIKEGYELEELSYSEPRANVDKEGFGEMVLRAKGYIAAGDIFQVVLSKSYELEVRGELLRFYDSLRRVNPSPYMYYLKMGERRIVGSSPEMLFRVEGEAVETFPIAGTRPWTNNNLEDRRLRRDLLADPKDRAEHVMLVDLARNDVGKVSKFGSVRVNEFMKVHRFSHVQHIVTHVRGLLREGCDCYDALRAVFPAGTVSGAPKVRAMEIIEELEPCRRGPYAGALGYFSYNGNSDFAITIRTLVARGEGASIQVGAGIVADSVPESEWFETEHKAAALIKALEVAQGDKG